MWTSAYLLEINKSKALWKFGKISLLNYEYFSLRDRLCYYPNEITPLNISKMMVFFSQILGEYYKIIKNKISEEDLKQIRDDIAISLSHLFDSKGNLKDLTALVLEYSKKEGQLETWLPLFCAPLDAFIKSRILDCLLSSIEEGLKEFRNYFIEEFKKIKDDKDILLKAERNEKFTHYDLEFNTHDWGSLMFSLPKDFQDLCDELKHFEDTYKMGGEIMFISNGEKSLILNPLSQILNKLEDIFIAEKEVELINQLIEDYKKVSQMMDKSYDDFVELNNEKGLPIYDDRIFRAINNAFKPYQEKVVELFIKSTRDKCGLYKIKKESEEEDFSPPKIKRLRKKKEIIPEEELVEEEPTEESEGEESEDNDKDDFVEIGGEKFKVIKPKSNKFEE